MAGEMDWGSVRSGGSGEGTPFLKLEPGSNQIRIVGKPYQVDIHWEKGLDGSNKKVVCPGAGCPVCKAGHVPMARFQVLAINRKTNKVEILEGGPKIFGEFKQYAMDPDYGDPSKYDFKIKKEGSGRETKYTVMGAPKKSDLTAEELDMVNNSKSLTDINKPKTIEEIMTMGLEILAGSVADLDDWGSDAKSESSSSEDGKDLGITDDDWDTL
ncbi:hypothetical protein D3C81_742260 [compost metagenome]